MMVIYRRKNISEEAALHDTSEEMAISGDEYFIRRRFFFLKSKFVCTGE